MPLSAASSSYVSSIAEEPPSKKQIVSAPSSSSLLLLPDEIILNFLSRLPRCYYPVISLVCKTFRRLIASPEIYVDRSALGCTERVLYVALRSHATETPRWYTLNFKPFGNDSINNRRLVPIPSFPSVPCWGMSMVALDSEIYVLGGCIDDQLVSTGFVVHCPSNTCRYLPSMKQARGCAAVGIVCGKLYVIGGCDPLSLNWVEAFDLKTQTWETVSGVRNVNVHDLTIRSFVIDDKIYIMDRKNSFVYDPKEGSLESDELLDTQWSVGSCVIDGRVYTFGSKNKIWVFDPVARVWGRLKGLEGLPDKRDGSRMSNLGGNLAIIFNLNKGSSEISCTKISLEKRGRKIWGTVLWSNTVMTLKTPSTIVRCLAVTV
ncbi:PREDICTED: F-box/kelch-repeat protein At4g39240-like [Camelina sativa]|uniref:F-box/kelch-repeat protein At4g39240-like n=1 Tax=Camelina sativa TaxID=90675 RepID=A0ABM0UU97_CAMSA|nr:PREDICTED: F-box/kelch-repeat protein At4g39240-like [Camelina sativa]